MIEVLFSPVDAAIELYSSTTSTNYPKLSSLTRLPYKLVAADLSNALRHFASHLV